MGGFRGGGGGAEGAAALPFERDAPLSQVHGRKISFVQFLFSAIQSLHFGHKCSQYAYSKLSCVSVKLDCFNFFWQWGGSVATLVRACALTAIGTAPVSNIMKYFSIFVQYGIQAFAKFKCPKCTRLHLRVLNFKKFSRGTCRTPLEGCA